MHKNCILKINEIFIMIMMQTKIFQDEIGTTILLQVLKLLLRDDAFSISDDEKLS